MLDRLYTRMYFPPRTTRRTRPIRYSRRCPSRNGGKLVAERSDDGYAWTVYVQDLDPNGVETPFFSI